MGLETPSRERSAAARSSLARLDPRWRLAGLVLAIAAVAAVKTPAGAAAAWAFGSALALMTRVLPSAWLRAVAVALVVTTPFAVWLLVAAALGFAAEGAGGLGGATVVVMKACALATLAAVLLAGGPAYEALAAAGSLGIPRSVVRIGLLAGRYLGQASRDFRRLRRAARLRGFDADGRPRGWLVVGHLAGSALVRGADRGERVAQAMRCRGFDGRLLLPTPPRTSWREFAWMAAVVVACGVGLAWDLSRG